MSITHHSIVYIERIQGSYVFSYKVKEPVESFQPFTGSDMFRKPEIVWFVVQLVEAADLVRI